MDGSWVAVLGALSGLGGLVTGIGALAVSVISTLHKNRLESRAATMTEQTTIIEQMRRELGRHEAYISTQQKAIETLHQEHTQCREESSQLRFYLMLLHDYARRTHKVLAKAGIAYEEPPELPQAMQTAARTVAQATAAMAAVSSPSSGVPPLAGP